MEFKRAPVRGDPEPNPAPASEEAAFIPAPEVGDADPRLHGVLERDTLPFLSLRDADADTLAGAAVEFWPIILFLVLLAAVAMLRSRRRRHHDHGGCYGGDSDFDWGFGDGGGGGGDGGGGGGGGD